MIENIQLTVETRLTAKQQFSWDFMQVQSSYLHLKHIMCTHIETYYLMVI